MKSPLGNPAGNPVANPTPFELKDPQKLRQEIDEWMANYDEKQEEKKRLARETQVDEDGFTKVISGITKTPDGLTIRGAARPKTNTGVFGEALAASKTPAPQVGVSGKKKKKNKDRVEEAELKSSMDLDKNMVDDNIQIYPAETDNYLPIALSVFQLYLAIPLMIIQIYSARIVSYS